MTCKYFLILFIVSYSSIALPCSWVGAMPQNIEKLYNEANTVFLGQVIETSKEEYPTKAKLLIN